MGRVGKRFQKAKGQVESKIYTLEEAIPLVKKLATAKFDETVEVAMRLGVDPKHADQMVRGTVVLPHGLGRTKKVCVIAAAEKTQRSGRGGSRSLRAAKNWLPRSSRKVGWTLTL